ncbi:hypothetical protein B0H16DRAFT_1722366 [Mycena metata]|uniref:Uncharacterized protein n=1 Tax=Mycena metata TaxID=1033252 RepID=A0AAD7NDG4_9AGAR|nr:hypothetical protein B0H16DRAFT_1722366 [Mycena metata]
METSLLTQDPPRPSLPEDLEREITEVLLDEMRDMRGPMSLVASRFYAWTKPIKFHTVIVHPQDGWMQRMNDSLTPDAELIRILVLDLPFNKNGTRYTPSDEELACIRGLLGASSGVRHLAVTWNIWEYLQAECGSLRLESLYLIWDGVRNIKCPSVENLQYPAALVDFSMFAPPSLDGWHPPEIYLPWTLEARCPNLAYVTYVSRFIVLPYDMQNLKGFMSVAIRERKDRQAGEEEEDFRVKSSKEELPNLSTLYLRALDEVLGHWLNKKEGRESAFKHPPPRVTNV